IFNEYEEQRVGDRLTIGRRLNQYWTASVTGRVEDIEGRNISIFAPPDYQEIEGHNFLVSARLAFTRDSRDSYLRPTEGSVLDVSFEQATGDFTFPLFNVDFNQYWTIFQRADGTGRHVLTLHSQLGIAGANTPVFERYFAGGFRSIRGFAFRGVGPTDPFGNFKLGGGFQFLNSREYPISAAA